MSRIDVKFADLKSKKESAFVTFLMAGDPTIKESHTIFKKLPKLGVDIIEIGMPFTDPMADGPTIQRACERALKQKVSCFDIFELVKSFRKKNKTTPVVLMGYLNPIERIGYEKFSKLASDSGVDAVLVVDLPHEEAEDIVNIFKKDNLESIFLIAPNTQVERINKISKFASGFLYYISLKGVTGASTLNIQETEAQLKKIKDNVNLPLAVGFGIKDAETAKTLSKSADAIVIGSAIVKIIENDQESKTNINNGIIDLMKPIRLKLDSNISTET